MNDKITKQLFIIEHNEEQTKAALFEDEKLIEYFVETQQNRSLVGNIYRGKVRKIAPQMNALFIDIGMPKMGLLSARDVSTKDFKQTIELEKLFYEGQIVWVQVHKDVQTSKLEIDDKGVRLTTELSLETENLVFLPDNSGVLLSKQITDKQSRESLKNKVIDRIFEQNIEGGFIIRSNVNDFVQILDDIHDNGLQNEHFQNEQWLNDIETLWERWQEIKTSKKQATKVGLIYQSSSLVERLRNQCLQRKIQKVNVLEGLMGLFEQFDLSVTVLSEDQLNQKLTSLKIDDQLQQALEPVVMLPEGGSIIIEETEALTVIDVNMGTAIKHGQTALQVNMNSAAMIAQQLILRNIAGMIVIDFIRMQRKKDRETLLQHVNKLMAADNIKVAVYGYTRLGLFEISRERIRPCLANIV